MQTTLRIGPKPKPWVLMCILRFFAGLKVQGILPSLRFDCSFNLKPLCQSIPHNSAANARQVGQVGFMWLVFGSDATCHAQQCKPDAFGLHLEISGIRMEHPVFQGVRLEPPQKWMGGQSCWMHNQVRDIAKGFRKTAIANHNPLNYEGPSFFDSLIATG